MVQRPPSMVDTLSDREARLVARGRRLLGRIERSARADPFDEERFDKIQDRLGRRGLRQLLFRPGKPRVEQQVDRHREPVGGFVDPSFTEDDVEDELGGGAF